MKIGRSHLLREGRRQFRWGGVCIGAGIEMGRKPSCELGKGER
jgi:hypothetical protein